MNIEDQLQNLKNEYQGTKAPNYLIYNGWLELKLKLTDRKNNFLSAYLKKALIFAALVLFVLATTAKVSQAAKPGDKLYPLKLATENITSFVTGDQTNKIENRAQEIINLTKENDQNLDAAIKRYEDTVDASKDNTSEKNRQELRNTLHSQEEKLKEAETTSPEDQKLIERALEKTREVQGEIKGARDSNKNEQEGENKNQNSSHSLEGD